MKKQKILEKNKIYSEKFTQPIKNPKLSKEIKKILEENKIKSMVDLGCGDGVVIHAIKKEFPRIKIVGVDISPRRINNLKKKFPEEKFYVKDVRNIKLKKKFDFVHSSQVIEHVPSDKKMVKEMHDLLNKKGILFISTVLKKPWAIYKYWNNGKFVLDPTHEREYGNQKEFLNLFKANFKLIKSWIIPVKRIIFGVSIKVPGYYLIFGIWKKRK